MPPRFIAASLAIVSLTACHGEQAPMKAQRIALDQVPSQSEEPLPSPDTKGAGWVVSQNGQAIDFEKSGARPFLSLACGVKAGQPRVTIIRHAPARPGEKALFPVIGGGIISRFKVDAALADNEWRWQGTMPADDPGSVPPAEVTQIVDYLSRLNTGTGIGEAPDANALDTIELAPFTE